jgi:hypothetical protein
MQHKIQTAVAVALATVFTSSLIFATTADARNSKRGMSRDGIMRLGGPSSGGNAFSSDFRPAVQSNGSGCRFCSSAQVREFFLTNDRLGKGN